MISVLNYSNAQIIPNILISIFQLQLRFQKTLIMKFMLMKDILLWNN